MSTSPMRSIPIRKLCKEFNVVCLVYDPMHLEDMAQRLRRIR